MRSILLGLTAALAGAAAPALAQAPADKADARCILVLGLAASQDPKQRERASQGSFFYLGRLASHGVSAKLGPVLIAEAKAITTPQQVQAELTRCGAELNTRARELATGMQELQKAGQAAAAAAAPPKPAAPPTK